MREGQQQRVAVIGGGWAGIAAATELIERGLQVTLFEASRQLGGRARSMDWQTSDGRKIVLDNGQHILIGAYQSTLMLMQTLGIDPAKVLLRMPLTVVSTHGLVLKAPRLFAPLHLLVALMTAKGLSWTDRRLAMQLMQTARKNNWQIGSDYSVSRWLLLNQQSHELRKKIWEPLCIATLNTPASIASAQVFLNVLRDSLGGIRSASDFLIPATHLGALLPEVAHKRLSKQAKVRLGQRITSVTPMESGLRIKNAEQVEEEFDAAILAVSALHVPPFLTEALALQPAYAKLIQQCKDFTWQSITTIYLLYPQSPFKAGQPPMLMLDNDPASGDYGQWAFDRGRLGGEPGLIGVVVSADGPHRKLTPAQLVECIVLQLRTQMKIRGSPSEAKVLTEKRATFACTPGLQRPGVRTPDPRLFLAGDYVMSDYPATLESAVRSGMNAAAQVVKLLKD